MQLLALSAQGFGAAEAFGARFRAFVGDRRRLHLGGGSGGPRAQLGEGRCRRDEGLAEQVRRRQLSRLVEAEHFVQADDLSAGVLECMVDLGVDHAHLAAQIAFAFAQQVDHDLEHLAAE